MVGLAPHHLFSYEEYLEHERRSGLKHEFLAGQVLAMAGGTPEHARLITEIALALRGLVDPKRCRVFTAELKIRVVDTTLATYPDVAVVCGDVERDENDSNAVVNPTVLVEVLSPSTEAYDRGEKWAHYRRLTSLQAYVLVSQAKPRLEIFERSNREFVHRVAEAGGHLAIACLGGSVGVDALYVGALD